MSKTQFHGLNINNTIIIVSDFIALILCIGLCFNYEFYINRNYFLDLLDPILLLKTFVYLITLQVCVMAVGLYNEKLRKSLGGVIWRVIVACGLAYIVSIFLFDLSASGNISNNFNEITTIFCFIALAISRITISRLGLNLISKRRILILGAGSRASIIESCMRRSSDRVGLDVLGFVPMDGDDVSKLKHEKIIDLTLPLESYVKSQKVHEIVIALDERRNNLPSQSLFACKSLGVKITDIIDFVERETGQVAVNHLDPSWALYYSHQSTGYIRKSVYWLFNAAIALALAIVTLPFMLLTAFFIKIECGKNFPILYSQERVGLNGKIFQIYKFTSMCADAEKNGAQWAEKEDPRVTRVGKFIRKYRIDELPQLYNVIIGDMHFVGPRPERPQFTKDFDGSIPYYSQRHNVKPGLTGWAQLKYPYGSSEKDAVEKLKFDLYYIKHRNFFLDLLILVKTSEIILFGRGR